MAGKVTDSNEIRLRAALDRWHNIHPGSGNSQTDSIALEEQIKAHPNIQKFLKRLENGNLINPAVADALVAKWKSDKRFLDNLDNNLADPAVADQLRQAMGDPKNTQALIAVINAVGQEVPPAPAPAPAAGVSQPNPGASPPAAAPAPAAGRTASSTAPAGGQQAPPPTAPPPAGGHAAGGQSAGASGGGGSHGTGAPQSAAGGGGQENLVMEAVAKLAAKAKEFGIDQATIDGFVETVRKGTGKGGLQERIYKNLKDNPQLVTAVDGLGEMDVNKLGYFKTTVKVQFVDLLSDPNKLADPNYAKFLISVAPRSSSSPAGQQNGAGRSTTTGFDFSNFGAGLQGAFGKIGEFFSSENLGKLKDTLMGLFNKLGEFINSLFSSGGTIFSMAGGPGAERGGQRMSAHVAPAGSRSPVVVDAGTGSVSPGGYRGDVPSVGPDHRRLPGAAPGGTNGPGGHAVV